MTNVENELNNFRSEKMFLLDTPSVIRTSSFLRHWVFRHSSFLSSIVDKWGDTNCRVVG